MFWNSNVFFIFKPLSLTMFWVPPMRIYIGTETSFIMGFSTDLYVVFGSCHKDNVVVVTKDYLIFISVSVYVLESVFLFEYVNMSFANNIIFYFCEPNPIYD